MTVVDAREDMAQLRERFSPIEFVGLDQRRHDRPTFDAALTAGKQSILAP